MIHLHQIDALRKLAVPLLARVNPGDIRINHHYTGKPIRLHSFKHKGYWYHGRNRERATMLLFGRLLMPGDQVFEVGGHIGYISLFFAHWVGVNGAVCVFEPGPNNLPYLRENVAAEPNVFLVEKAVGAEDGGAEFYVEELTGQNNTLVRGYEVFDRNREKAHVESSYSTVQVEVIQLDTFAEQQDRRPDFVKIDVEGAEIGVLQGMQRILREDRPALMVEVTRSAEDVFDLLQTAGYVLFRDDITSIRRARDADGNVFALHKEIHGRIVAGLGLT